MINTGIKYLLKELSMEFGIIDFKQPVQTAYLFNLMQELDLPVNLIQETISRLLEDEKEKPLDPEEKEKVKQKGLEWKGFGGGYV